MPYREETSTAAPTLHYGPFPVGRWRMLVAVLIALLVFAPQWLPTMVAIPAAVMIWRAWITAHHRGAIRRLAAGLPWRLSPTASP
jgi:hypothetical protein